MEWFQVRPKDLRQGPLALAEDAPLGSWLRLTAACADLENFGRFVGCRTYGTRQWMTVAGVTAEAIPVVVAAGLASWDGDALVIHGYDIEQQTKATVRSAQNRDLANRRWGNVKDNAAGDAKGNTKGITEGNTKGNAAGNAEGEGEGKEIREEKIKEEERETDIRPDGGPSGPIGAGEGLPLLKLVPTEPAGPEAKKASKPDSVNSILAVFAHYRQKHDHERRYRTPKASKAWRLVQSRLVDGFSIEELCQAVDGYHKSPYHLGQNDQGREYLDLELIMRDETHVAHGIEWSANPPKAGAGTSAGRDIRVGNARAEDFKHDGPVGPVENF
jgi:hypothetical protein